MPENNTSVQSITIGKSYGVITATAIVIANMIGSGIFTITGVMASQLPGPGWVIFCWLFGGLIALSGALCYSELATRMPESGGEYIYLKKLYHPLLGFLTGWTSLIVGFSVAIALSAMGFSEYFVASLSSNVFSSISGIQLVLLKKAIAILIILAFTVLHFMGTRFGGKVQNFLTVIKILFIICLTSLGFIFGKGSWSNISLELTRPSDGFAIGTAMMMVMFAYSGWNAIAYISGELKNPRKTLPVSLITGTLIVIVLYLIINLFFFYSAPFSELKGKITVFDAASNYVFGDWIKNILNGSIALMMLSSLSAFLIIGPRVYYAMAKDRLFFSFASRVHSRYKVPSKSILLQGIIAIFMVLIGSFEQLLIYIGFALSIFPFLTVIGLFKARRLKVGEGNAVKTIGYPFVPFFFLISSFSLMIVAYINRPLESSIAVMTVLIGIPFYYLWLYLEHPKNIKKI